MIGEHASGPVVRIVPSARTVEVLAAKSQNEGNCTVCGRRIYLDDTQRKALADGKRALCIKCPHRLSDERGRKRRARKGGAE